MMVMSLHPTVQTQVWQIVDTAAAGVLCQQHNRRIVVNADRIAPSDQVTNHAGRMCQRTR